MRTKPSGGNLSRKHFPKEAAWGARAGREGPLPGDSPPAPPTPAHPQQRFLGLGLVLVAGRLDALAHGLREQLLVLDLPQVLVRLLALLLRGARPWGSPSSPGSPRPSRDARDRPPRHSRVMLAALRSGAPARTSYSFCASSSRAPGAMEAMRKISWLASAGRGENTERLPPAPAVTRSSLSPHSSGPWAAPASTVLRCPTMGSSGWLLQPWGPQPP